MCVCVCHPPFTERIAQHYDNMYRYMNVSAEALGWLATQHTWLEEQLATAKDQQDPFWVTVGLLMDQFNGVVKVGAILLCLSVRVCMVVVVVVVVVVVEILHRQMNTPGVQHS